MTTTGIESGGENGRPRPRPPATGHDGRQVDGAGIAVFRILFGALLVVSVVRFFVRGWIHDYYVVPRFFFGFFDWLKPWPGNGMYVHYAVMGVAAVGIMTGFAYRASLLVFFAGFVFAELLDKTTYLNHYYLVSLLLLLLLLLPKPTLRTPMPRSALWILRAQVAVVYVFAGIAKLNSDWLIRAQPLRLWLAREGFAQFALMASWCGAAFDLFVVPALLWRRTRPYAFAVVVVFHIVTALLFNIGLFPWIMMASATLFFSPDWPRRFLPALQPARTWMLHPAVFALLAWVEVILPNHDRFAWRVMLQERSGAAELTVVERGTGRRFEVEPREELTPLQAKMMVIQPDMIAQYGRHLAESFAARGIDVESVHVRSRVSINGRPAVALIDEAVNLLTF